MPLVRIRIKCPKPKDYPENPKTLDEHIKKRRIELGLTQKQAAQALGVNPWTVMNWETGRFEPPIRWLPAILRFLGYDPFPPPITVGERRCGLGNWGLVGLKWLRSVALALIVHGRRSTLSRHSRLKSSRLQDTDAELLSGHCTPAAHTWTASMQSPTGSTHPGLL